MNRLCFSLLLPLLLAACGAEETHTARDWAHWKARALAAAQLPGPAAPVVEAHAYGKAFAVLDPGDDAVQVRRAGMAFGAGRAFVRALRENPKGAVYWRQRVLQSAEAFLVTSQRLDPDRGWVHLQRAQLRDLGDPMIDDHAAARADYAAFVAWAASGPPARTNPPADDAPAMQLARARLAVLGG